MIWHSDNIESEITRNSDQCFRGDADIVNRGSLEVQLSVTIVLGIKDTQLLKDGDQRFHVETEHGG